MFIELLHRQLRVVRRGVSRRVEICPPALLQRPHTQARGWRAGLREWLSTGWNTAIDSTPARALGAALDPRFCRVRDEFAASLQDIRSQEAGILQSRIRIARSLRELWHLRPELFRVLALRFSQGEAQCRLDRLNRHFPTRSPRSGFAALDAQLPARVRRKS